MTAARRARVAFLAGALVVVLALIGYSVFGLQVHQVCSHDALDTSTSFWLVSVSIGGFVGGHVLAGWLEATDPPRAADPGGRWPKVVVQLLLVVFLGLVAILLAYEGLALSDVGANWPITYFVRCFAHTNAWATGVGAFAICTLLGQWAWYPQR